MPSVKIDQFLKAGIVLLSAVLVFVLYASIHERIIVVSDSAPDFSITADNGRIITPTNFGGRLLVLNFWATWCQPCVEEVPSLDEFAKTMAGSGVVVLGVSMDTNPKLYHDFLSRTHVSFMTARDPEAKISADYGTFKYPESYIIDAKGKVVQKIVGATNWTDADMVNAVRSLL
ncbi:MAG TPA: TlpA disulfide reductase family protein [Bryobacteraceae bacterium]|jgi:peroxiredoxin|nr:TlpA disulfide reductase family protein [Bryobacteraceae bacterium]